MALDEVVSLWPHEGIPADVVRQLKYGRSSALVTVLADRLAQVKVEVDVVTWCPAEPRNAARRGFDQAELLARAVAARWGIPCRRLLVRRAGPPQTSRTAAQRREGPVLRSRGGRLTGRRVAVIDDVTTTGATLHAAAHVLERRGAVQVVGITATRSTSAHLRRGVCSV